MKPADILAGIELVCSRGGDVFVAAGDRLNVEFGYQARVTLPNGTADGAVFRGGGDTPAAALAAALARVQPAAPERRASSRIEGRWYVTERAVREYLHLMRPRPLDDEQATDELIELSRHAHRVREQDNGLTLWRVKAPNGARIRLLVGPAHGIRGNAADAIVQVLGEHGGAHR